MSNVSTRSTHPWRGIAVTIISLSVVLGSLYLWRSHNVGATQAWPQQAVPVNAQPVTAEVLSNTVEVVGELRAVNQVVLSAEVSGRITKIHFTSGQGVSAQQPLVDLYDGIERAQLSDAQAYEALTDAELTRSQQLAPIGAESKELLAQRIVARQRASAVVEQRQAALSLKHIHAPFDGTLGIRQADLGQYVNPGDPLVSITDLTQLYVDFSIPQQFVGGIEQGASVYVHVDGYPEQIFVAKVSAIEPQLDTDTRNVKVQATLDNPNHLLKPNMYAKAELVMSENPSAILVPMTAIVTSAQGNSVVVIEGDSPMQAGQAQYVAVQIGRRVGDRVVVTAGLKEGQVVITSGQNRIQPQAEVVVQAPATETRGGAE